MNSIRFTAFSVFFCAPTASLERSQVSFHTMQINITHHYELTDLQPTLTAPSSSFSSLCNGFHRKANQR